MQAAAPQHAAVPVATGKSAPKAKEIQGAGRDKAGTFPIQLLCLFELVALACRPDLPPEDSVIVFFARSFLALGLLCSCRVQDLEECEEVRIDEFEPDDVIHAWVRRSKNGEPIELYARAIGLLGPLHWWPRHRDKCRRIGHPFRAYAKPHGSGGLLALSPSLMLNGVMSGDDIRAGMQEVCCCKPLCIPMEIIKALRLRGHSPHGTFNDWMKSAGAWPDLFGETEQGFSKHDRDASGHWLSFSATDEDETPPPPRKQDAGKKTGSGNDDMTERYGRGIGRSGERTEQLRIRSRLIDFAARALARWCKHWGCSWMRLPAGHASKRLLSEQPERVQPCEL